MSPSVAFVLREEPRSKGGAIKPKIEIPNQVRDDKKREPNNFVMFKHLVCYFLPLADAPIITALAYHRQAQNGVFRCGLNKPIFGFHYVYEFGNCQEVLRKKNLKGG